ncbi:hypothetical protein B0H63DRAFT_230350 [Podospora didyma]|uniref:Uncharacterized protein n=1 Tax=Podospora didyma TaxID=330526 RepID=A0AAE0KK13_9PEZI|nr:hypothetical protein B0H63DRAFT_230350 [Podospora didyma]
MFAVMPATVFSFGHDASSTSPAHRPVVSSPLSSSPIRASSSSKAQGYTHSHRDTQSSPITAPPKSTKFKYATRNSRPNPIIQRREDAQDSRRRLFLHNVRQRADERKWDKRGGEDELLKLEWWRLNRELQQAKLSAVDFLPTERDIEDEPQLPGHHQQPEAEDLDALMVDDIEQQEQAEIDAMVALLPAYNTPHHSVPPSPHHFSDDEDYDGLFMDLLSHEETSGNNFSMDVEMS